MISDFGSYEGQKDLNQGWNENQNNDTVSHFWWILVLANFHQFNSFIEFRILHRKLLHMTPTVWKKIVLVFEKNVLRLVEQFIRAVYSNSFETKYFCGLLLEVFFRSNTYIGIIRTNIRDVKTYLQEQENNQ